MEIGRTTGSHPQLLVVGISARAAAFSALRAGYDPLAIDCFADDDLAAVCDCVRVDLDAYPDGFEQAARGLAACPWLYAGGLENAPSLVRAISDQRSLYGNPDHVLRTVRNPFRLAQTLRTAGLPFLDVRATRPTGASGPWLRKPLKSGGGRRIERIASAADPEPFEGSGNRRRRPMARGGDASVYYQQYRAGTDCSAVFVAAGGQAACLGVTRQIIGAAWTGANEFWYAGSVGPLDLTADQRRLWDRIGAALAAWFALTGLFGVDAVMDEDAIWPVEVNPRYTASIEILELAGEVTAIAAHTRACEQGELPRGWPDGGSQRVGKAVLYAESNGRVPSDFGRLVRDLNQDIARPIIADVPPAGRDFHAGEPLATVLAYADTIETVVDSLRTTSKLVRKTLEGEG